MSIPAFGWALEQGKRLRLRPSDRLVLVFIADQANVEGICRSASQERIHAFTGLKRKTIQAATSRLIEAQLIRVIAAVGLVTKYEILRPITPVNGAAVGPGKRARGTPVKRTMVAPVNGAVVEEQKGPYHPGKTAPEPRSNGPVTPVKGDPVPSSSQESSPKKREEASKDLSAGKKEGGGSPPTPPTTAPPPQAPTLGATNGSGSGYRDPNAPSRSSNDFLDDPSPHDALPCEIEQDVLHGEVMPPDAPVSPQATNAFVHSLARNFQNNYPPRAPRLSRAEQIELCQPKPHIKPLYAPDAQLRAARLALAQRTAATAPPP